MISAKRLALSPRHQTVEHLTRTKTWHAPSTTVIALSICVPISALLAGGNHPVVWLTFASYIGVVSAFVCMACPQQILNPLRQHRLLFTIALVPCLFAILQATCAYLLPLDHSVSGTAHFALPQSIAPSITFLAAIRTFSLVLFFLLILSVADCNRSKRIIVDILFAAAFFQALVGLILLRMSLPPSEFDPSLQTMATGTFVSHNSYATFLGMGFVLGLASFLCADGEFTKKWLYLAPALCVVLLALVASQSRMGVFSTAIAAMFVFTRVSLSSALKAAMTGVVLFLILYATDSGVLHRLAELSESARTRGQFYSQVIELAYARPLFGFGADTFATAFQLVHRPPVSAEFVWDRAHSTYLGLWVEYGLVVGSLPIVVGVLVLAKLCHIQKSSSAMPDISKGAIAALSLGALHSLFDFSLEMHANSIFLLALTATALGRTKNDPTIRSSL